MEQPGERPGEGEPADLPSQEVLIERELTAAVYENRIASGDALLFAAYAAKVLAKLREVAPDLVEAAELEVRFEMGVHKGDDVI